MVYRILLIVVVTAAGIAAMMAAVTGSQPLTAAAAAVISCAAAAQEYLARIRAALLRRRIRVGLAHNGQVIWVGALPAGSASRAEVLAVGTSLSMTLRLKFSGFSPAPGGELDTELAALKAGELDLGVDGSIMLPVDANSFEAALAAASTSAEVAPPLRPGSLFLAS